MARVDSSFRDLIACSGGGVYGDAPDPAAYPDRRSFYAALAHHVCDRDEQRDRQHVADYIYEKYGSR